ncbi:hypothetical protein M413DRAFT_439147 [Hebeloma cylindrosporum]|uniref:Uncharacterized protein n=1 Tax=Hebeloma cylindrosporum TaxID=76867 RepID=A0A0C3CUB5_HEBCY|nr:hypothetical protein M413DRAFT_439147 [Hebeloma cylindrosporum h7]
MHCITAFKKLPAGQFCNICSRKYRNIWHENRNDRGSGTSKLESLGAEEGPAVSLRATDHREEGHRGRSWLCVLWKHNFCGWTALYGKSAVRFVGYLQVAPTYVRGALRETIGYNNRGDPTPFSSSSKGQRSPLPVEPGPLIIIEVSVDFQDSNLVTIGTYTNVKLSLIMSRLHPRRFVVGQMATPEEVERNSSFPRQLAIAPLQRDRLCEYVKNGVIQRLS